MKITIDNNIFYTDFINTVNTYTEEVYQISLNIKHLNEYNSFEMANILLVNTALFEHFYSFKLLLDHNLIHSSYNSFRAGMETFRVLLLLLQSKDFLKNFCQNSNWKFREVRDQHFLQSTIVKELSKLANESNTENNFWKQHNEKYIKSTPFSEIHSELSKSSHLTNTNLLMLLNTENNNQIYLGIGLKEPNEYAQNNTIKLFELLYLILSDYQEIIYKLVPIERLHKDPYFNKSNQTRNELYDLYTKYIELRYK